MEATLGKFNLEILKQEWLRVGADKAQVCHGYGCHWHRLVQIRDEVLAFQLQLLQPGSIRVVERFVAMKIRLAGEYNADFPLQDTPAYGNTCSCTSLVSRA